MLSFTRLVPSKVQILQAMNSLTRGLETSIHVHLKVWQGKRPYFKMLTEADVAGWVQK